MKRWLQFLLSVALVCVGFGGALALVRAKPAAKSRAETSTLPVVETIKVSGRRVALTVPSRGLLKPVVESDLAMPLAGQVARRTDALSVGAWVNRGQVLLELDRRRQGVVVKEAEARVARARLQLARERAEADLAARQWAGEAGPQARDSSDSAGPSRPALPVDALALREPQLAGAQAELAAALAAAEQARVDWRRMILRAPFDGRLSAVEVEVGEFVGVGQTLARLVGAEVEAWLPVSLDQLARIDVQQRPEVWLSSTGPGPVERVRGTVLRTTGELHRQSQQQQLIVRIESAASLDPGRFVEAVIHGRVLPDAMVIPNSALHSGNRVAVLDAERRLRWRTVTVAQQRDRDVVLTAGLMAGEEVCVTPTRAAEGTLVAARQIDDPTLAAPELATTDLAGASVLSDSPSIASVPAGTTASTLSVSSQETAQPHKSPVTESGPDCAMNATLGTIETRRIDDTTEVWIGVDGPIAYRTLMMDSPPRYVIDLDSTVSRQSFATTSRLPGLIGVRAGSFSACPRPTARVVLDLTTMTEPILRSVSSGLQIHIPTP